MSKEAMKLALEALKQIDEAMPFPVAKLAQSALRKALASEAIEQPAQQEPFAYYFEEYSYEGQKSNWFVACPCDGKLNGKPGIPLYTSPQAQRKPLTDEEIETVWKRVQANDFHDCVQPFARAIEAKLKEKNT